MPDTIEADFHIKSKLNQKILPGHIVGKVKSKIKAQF